MIAQFVPIGIDDLGNLRMLLDGFSNHKECRFDSITIENLEHLPRVARLGTVIERERHYFLRGFDIVIGVPKQLAIVQIGRFADDRRKYQYTSDP